MATAQPCEKWSLLSEFGWSGVVMLGPDFQLFEPLGNNLDMLPEKASTPMSRETATNGSFGPLSSCELLNVMLLK